MKKIIIIALFLSLISLSTVSSGWFSNTWETSTFEIEKIDGFYIDEDNDLIEDSLWLVNGQYGDKEPYASLDIKETNETYPSKDILNGANITKNYTKDNFISYMTDKNATISYIKLNDKIYEGVMHHYTGQEVPLEYNEELFMQDNEILQKTMSTIKSKN